MCKLKYYKLKTITITTLNTSLVDSTVKFTMEMVPNKKKTVRRKHENQLGGER